MSVEVNPDMWVNTVIFDLEFVGNIETPTKCGLWEIGATHLESDDSFHIILDPYLDDIPPPCAGCFNLTQEFLDNNAVPLKEGLQRFIEWGNKYRFFVSHNCFKSDTGVLRGSFQKCGIQPPNWLFMDSLLIIRQHIKVTRYTLNSLYKHYMQTEMVDSHRALSDAVALKQVLKMMGPIEHTTFAYPLIFTSLQNIRGIGHASELTLRWKGIRSVEELILNIQSEHSTRCLSQNANIEDTVFLYLRQCELPVKDYVSIVHDILWRIEHISSVGLCVNETKFSRRNTVGKKTKTMLHA